MKIVTKVSLGYTIVVLLLLGVGAAGFREAQTTKTNADRAKAALQATRNIKQYQLDATSVAVDANSVAYDYSSHGSPTGDYHSFTTAVAASDAASRAVHRLQLTRTEAAQLSAADRALQVYINQTEQLNADFKANTPASIAAGNNEVAALAFPTVVVPLGKLDALRAASLEAWVNAAATQAHTDEILLLLGALAAIAVAVALSLISARGIRRPLTETAQVLERVAEGDLTVRMDWTNHDEFGVMAAALNTSVSTMHDVVAELDAQAERLSEFAEQAVSHTSADARSADAKTLAEMATNLTAMISLFTIERTEDRPADPTELTPKAESATSSAAADRAVAA
jgi:methyl-accepting chemotaxis protein